MSFLSFSTLGFLINARFIYTMSMSKNDQRMHKVNERFSAFRGMTLTVN